MMCKMLLLRQWLNMSKSEIIRDIKDHNPIFLEDTPLNGDVIFNDFWNLLNQKMETL